MKKEVGTACVTAETRAGDTEIATNSRLERIASFTAPAASPTFRLHPRSSPSTRRGQRLFASIPVVVLASLLSGCGGEDNKPIDPFLMGGSDPMANVKGLKFWTGDLGPTGPVFTGPQQKNFLCRTLESGMGQPVVDSQDSTGHPVFQIEGNIASGVVGYSMNCSVKTRVQYFYYTGDNFKPFDTTTGYTSPPADMKTTTLNGNAVPFIVRVEGGTINRFLYTIAMLAPFPESTSAPDKLDKSAWNKKLVYWLRGGVGIGHQQSTAMWFNNGLYGDERQIMPKILEQGFAVVTSTGNETGAHYNLRLAEETALMTKEHFVQTYGKPKFTIGLGISGGAVQQYVFAQNRPGLLDGGIPVESFPDMVTQTITAADCPLLGQYAKDDVARDPNSLWAKWSNQRLIQGSNASDSVKNAFFGTPGSTECINAWGTTVPTVLNPVYKTPKFNVVAKAYGYAASAFDRVKWTHWNDLENIYGVDAKGFAPIPTDNVGVQYALKSLTDGKITPNEFLKINACVGGWKEQADFLDWDTAGGDAYDSRNQTRSANCLDPAGTPSPRRTGSKAAMNAAYTSGHVFTGERLGIPMIDLRPYLEPELNIHNARQSFSARARLAAGGASAHQQVIWFTGSNADLPDRIADALRVMDQYLSVGTAPATFVDKCVDTAGSLIAKGPAVWDGILNRNAPGACTTAYPIYSSSRMLAGESIKGDTFKCALKPVSQALNDGTYGTNVPFNAAETVWLKKIFANGVCDYTQNDQGRPAS